MQDMVVQGDKENTIFLNLMDASKLIADIYHSISYHRSFLIGPSLNSAWKNVVEQSFLDGNLFGVNLTERILVNQAVKKTKPPATTV